MIPEYELLEKNISSRLDTIFGVENSLIQVNPGKVLVPPKYQEFGEKIINFKVRPDDVWVLAYPRTGSTWTIEMIWCLLNNLDFKTAKHKDINFRCPLLELSAVFGHDEMVSAIFPDSVFLAESLPSPRCIKSHLAFSLLPRKLATVKPKIVCVVRHPKDVCVSYYHYCRVLHDLCGCSFDEFCELFLNGNVPLGSYFDYISGVWKLRNEPNVLFMKYEDLKKDLRGSAVQLANFLGKQLTTTELSQLIDHVSFEQMRQNPAVNLEDVMCLKHGSPRSQNEHFIRRGEVGDWRNHMTDQMSQRFDQVLKTLAEEGLIFD